MERQELIQRIKEISISFSDMDPDIILLIVKQSHNTFDIISDEEILKIAKNIRNSTQNVKGLSTFDMAEYLNNTNIKFDKAGFKEVKKLGEGAYGSVSQFETPQATYVAVKTSTDSVPSDVIKEIGSLSILSLIKSKYIPEYCGFNRNEICLEFADSDLSNWWGTATKDQLAKHLPRIVDDLLNGLSDLQSVGLIHGDIKPQNMLIWYNGDEIKKVAYTDFGLCSSHHPKFVRYTAIYRPPEYFDPYADEEASTTFQTDCWALAKSILTLCMTSDEIESMNDMYRDDDETTRYMIKERQIPEAPEKFKRYLRDDQVSQLTRMISEDPKNRCIVSTRGISYKREWGWIYGNEEITTNIFKWMYGVIIKYGLDGRTLLLSYDIFARYSENVDMEDHLSQVWTSASASIYLAGEWYSDYIKLRSLQRESGVKTKYIIESCYDILSALDGLIWIPGLEKYEETFEQIHNFDEDHVKSILEKAKYDISKL